MSTHRCGILSHWEDVGSVTILSLIALADSGQRTSYQNSPRVTVVHDGFGSFKSPVFLDLGLGYADGDGNCFFNT
jgi:hypothetical protein